MREEIPAPGFVIANDITFTISHDGTIDYVEMRDDTTKIEIRKIDSETKEPLPGARFEILDLEGNVMESWTSTEKAYRIEGRLTAGETYVLHEVEAPESYEKMEDRNFQVNQNGHLLSIEAENE